MTQPSGFLNNIGDRVASAANSFWASQRREEDVSPAKSAKRGPRTESPAEPVFNTTQVAFIEKAVTGVAKASTAAIAEVVYTEIEAVKAVVTEHDHRLGSLEEQTTEIKSSVDQLGDKLENLDIARNNDTNELRELISKIEETNRSSSSGTAQVPDPWFDAAFGRTGKGGPKGKAGKADVSSTGDEWSGLWVLGNLGYDTPTSELLSRAPLSPSLSLFSISQSPI